MGWEERESAQENLDRICTRSSCSLDTCCRVRRSVGKKEEWGLGVQGKAIDELAAHASRSAGCDRGMTTLLRNHD